MDRVHQIILIAVTLLASWLAMQDVHEFGHVVGAWLTGGQVARVVIHPLTISRTDISYNPHRLLVVWAGPVLGCLLPLAALGVAAALRRRWTYLLRFFAGFCLVANGAYIAAGSFDYIGDAGVMLRNGSPVWLLWAFGAVTIPSGLLLWHRQGKHFGMGKTRDNVSPAAAYACLATLLALIIFGLAVNGR
jgi:Peptidase M50B-like